MNRVWIAVFALILLLPICLSASTVAPVWVIHIDGQIDPAVAGYVVGGIKDAEDAAAQAVLVTIDTPGGLSTSMEEIIKAFFAAKIPVIAYVSPNGATAASAGTFITMAADIAAMAPVSNIGSASPINISPSGEVAKVNKTLERKQMNYAAEYAKSIAEKRGRNIKWAEKAVREAANLTSTNAVKLHVVDLIATSNRELMKEIDGRRVRLATGDTVILHTARAPFVDAPMGGWQTFLHYLSNPMIALLLLMMATYGIIFELSNPGAILPGVIGGISAILLLYSFSVIPINAAGFAFIALAIILFLADVYAPSHGVLSVGGVLSLFFGLMMLFKGPSGPMVPLWVLAVVALITGGFFVFVVSLGVKALRRPYIAGREGVVGHVGEARTDLAPTGKVFVNGTLWTATSESGDIEKGEKIVVTAMAGLKLTVRKQVSNGER